MNFSGILENNEWGNDDFAASLMAIELICNNKENHLAKLDALRAQASL